MTTTTEELNFEQKRRNEHVTEYLNGLTELHKFLYDNPEFVPMYGMEIVRYTNTAEELAEWLHKLGTFEKIDSNYISGGVVKIGTHQIKVQTDKGNTCKKILTGQIKTVAVEVDPRAPLPEGARNARSVTKVVYDMDEEETEWECPPSLLSPPVEEEDG